MAVTKQIYSLTVGFSQTDVIDQLEQALIDAGLMTGWYDSFTSGARAYGVFECVYDPTKTFGTTYYLFTIENQRIGVSIGTGWDTATNTFTGTQFLDYYLQPPDIQAYQDWGATTIGTPGIDQYSNTTTFNIYRYTSTVNSNQSWFVFQQGFNISYPFTFHNPAETLYPWLDLDLGMIPGLYATVCGVGQNAGATSFCLQSNIRRAYPYGQALTGYSSVYGNDTFNGLRTPSYTYYGCGKVDNAGTGNFAPAGSKIVIPVGSPGANPAYSQNYVPICSDLPWTPFSSSPLATDFGVYMHYANNTLNFEDRFVVDPGVEEWEILYCANNPTVTTGASPTFLARVV